MLVRVFADEVVEEIEAIIQLLMGHEFIGFMRLLDVAGAADEGGEALVLENARLGRKCHCAGRCCPPRASRNGRAGCQGLG